MNNNKLLRTIVEAREGSGSLPGSAQTTIVGEIRGRLLLQIARATGALRDCHDYSFLL